ncbi:MAG: hypothetical protein QGG40_10490, partial [Myxococcota bacterium]|nr:hypothetical protein [Myxococcota bacterium]
MSESGRSELFRRWLQRLLTVVSLVALGVPVWFVGTLGAGEPTGIEVVQGQARVDQGTLVLEPGAVVTVGQGRQLQVMASISRAPNHDGSLDLLHGPSQSPWHFGRFSSRAGLFGRDGLPLTGTSGQHWTRAEWNQLGLLCSPPLNLTVSGQQVAIAESQVRCQGGPLSLRAGTRVHVSQVWIDGNPVSFGTRGFDPSASARAAGVLALGVLLFGVDGWWVLLGVAGAGLVQSRHGVDPRQTLAVLLGLAVATQAVRRDG